MKNALSPFQTVLCFWLFYILPIPGVSQDSTFVLDKKVITLKEVVVRNNLNVPGFINRIQNDTTFYKAFKNLRIIGYTSLNDIRMLDKKGNSRASLQSKTRQTVNSGCRSMQVMEEKVTGDIYDKKREWNYYTAEVYANVFFTKGQVCGENNIVKGDAISTKGKSGIEKHKEQLKMLFFNPGSKVNGVPFIGNKLGIFEENMVDHYDFEIDMDNYLGQNCYIFRASAKEHRGRKNDDVVINQMTTWFNSQTMEIVARDYDMSYDAGVYDFDVRMEVQLAKFDDLLVPRLIRYTGNWHAIFKKRETGIFTATLFDFTK